MSDEVKKEHWAKIDANRKRFWVEAHALGFDNDEVHKILEVDSLYDWTGTGKEALEWLKIRKAKKDAWAADEQRAKRAQARAEDEPRLQGAVSSFPSLPVWASTEFVDPSGHRWKFCIAAGLQSDLRIMALDQVQDGIAEFNEMAACHGWKPVNGYRAQRPQQPMRPAQAQGVTQLPGVIASTRPASAQPPPPPPGQGAPATEQAQTGSYLDTEFIKIGLTQSNNPCVQFWNPNREYAEIVWYFGADKLRAKAPWLDTRGVTEQMLQTVSVGDAKIDIPCRVHYVLSDRKNSRGMPYKNITEIKPL